MGRRIAAGVLTAATVASVGAGQFVGQGQAQAGILDDVNAVKAINGSTASSLQEVIAQISGGAVNNAATQTILDQWRIEACGTGGTSSQGQADCSAAELTGIAIVLPGNVDLVPKVVYVPIQGAVNNPLVQGLLNLLGIENLTVPNAATPSGSATVQGSGFQFAVASTGGQAKAISYLPVSLATAGASDGRTAVAFAVIGMANAWTTDDVPVTVLGVDTGLDIPGIKSVSCYGGLTGAYAEGVGACANVAGIVDFRLDEQHQRPELQFATTDPTAILLDPSGVFGQVITQLLNGQPLNLSKDFRRLTIGGDRVDANGNPILFTLTSDYGTQDPITIHWLGSTIVLHPEVEVNGVMKPNHLGAPVFTFGTPTGAADLVPVIDIPEIKFPFGIPATEPVTIGSTPAPTLTSANPTMLRSMSVDGSETSAAGTSDAGTSNSETSPVTTEPATGVDAPSVDAPGVDAPATDDSTTSDTAGKHELVETGKHHSGVTASPDAGSSSGGGKHAAPEADSSTTDSATTDSATTDSTTASTTSTSTTSTGTTSTSTTSTSTADAA